LHIDCSAPGTYRGDLAKIFDGRKINIGWFLLPPPGFNSAVIAALELLHPEDEEKKNNVCKPHNSPDVPLDFFLIFLNHMTNSVKIRAELGSIWRIRRRTNFMHHMDILPLAKLLWLLATKTKPLTEKLTLWVENHRAH